MALLFSFHFLQCLILFFSCRVSADRGLVPVVWIVLQSDEWRSLNRAVYRASALHPNLIMFWGASLRNSHFMHRTWKLNLNCPLNIQTTHCPHKTDILYVFSCAWPVSFHHRRRSTDPCEETLPWVGCERASRHGLGWVRLMKGRTEEWSDWTKWKRWAWTSPETLPLFGLLFLF